MRRIIFYAITLFLVMFESSIAATESIPPIQKISDEAVSYGMNIDNHAPDAGSWKPFSDLNSRELIGNDEFWLKIQIPPGNHKHPAVYTQGYFSGLQAVLGDGRVIYRRGKQTGDRSEDVPDTRSFFLKHLIRLPAGMQGTPSNADAAALYLRIPYNNPYDIGWFDAIYAGEMDDLAALADENELDLLKVHLPLLCVGAVLFFFGILLFIIFGLRFKERDYPFLSLGFFSFTAGILYLNIVPVYAALDLSPRLWVTVEEVLTFLLPVGIVSFVAMIFSSSLTPLLRGLWKLQLVLTIGVVIWFLVSIVPSYVIFLGNVMALLCIVASLAAIYKSTAKKKSMSVALKVALTGFLIFLLTAALDVFYALGIVPFGGYYYGFGIVILILSFGYVLFDHYRTTMQNARDFAHELETARQIQSFILPHKTVDIKGIYLAAHYVPMASVAGDFYDFIKVDEKRLGILVADVCGHGVPASLISSMVKIAFSAQLPHAYNPAQVLSGINQILCGKLESDFVTAGYLFIDTEKQTATYAGAGHPPLLLWKGSEHEIHEFRTKGMILGQFEDARYQNIELHLESGDRFLLYTDGIIEATNTAGDRFGWDHFKELITSHANLSVGNFADGLIQGISNWSGKHIGEALDDDLTLVVADFKNN